MPGRRRRFIAVLSVLAVCGALGAFVVGRSLWWSLRPVPAFPALADRRPPGLVGTVAFLRPYPDDNCIWTVDVSGGSPHKVACPGAHIGPPEWLPDGRVQTTRRRGGEGTLDTRRWIVDPRSGAVESVPRREIEPPSPARDTGRGPRGEVVRSVSRRGRLTVRLTHEGTTRTLLSVAAPDTYTFGSPTWGPDGRWFVVKDDLDRLLLVTTSTPSATRVLAERGWAAAVAPGLPVAPR